MDDFVIAPSDGPGFVELARTKTGRMFRKHILNKGSLLHPKTGETIQIDDAFVSSLTRNFADSVCDIVQVPKAGPKNEHSEDPDRNIGEVVGLEEKDGKVYALFDCRSSEDADKLGKTLLGASAMMHMNYTDTRTGKKVGPTLLHMAVTNRPYVVDLEDYEELISASADSSGEPAMLTTATTEESPTMDLAELLDILKDEHGIDVGALQAQAEYHENDDQRNTNLSNVLASALSQSGLVQLSSEGDSVTDQDIIAAVAELANTNVALSGRLESLEAESAEQTVDALISAGMILPAKRETMIKLKLSNEELFVELLPDAPLVHLSREEGLEEVNPSNELDVDAEIARLAGVGKESGYIRS